MDFDTIFTKRYSVISFMERRILQPYIPSQKTSKSQHGINYSDMFMQFTEGL